MKTELRLRPHVILNDASVIEIWHDGVFIGQITGSDGPGIRIFSKHPIKITEVAINPDEIMANQLLDLTPISYDYSNRSPRYRFSTGGLPSNGVRKLREGWKTYEQAYADAVRAAREYENADRMGNMAVVLGVTTDAAGHFYGVVNCYHSNT